MPTIFKIKGESALREIRHSSTMHPVFCGGQIWASLSANVMTVGWTAGSVKPIEVLSIKGMAKAYVEKNMTETTVIIIASAKSPFATTILNNLPDKWKDGTTEYLVTKIPEFRNQHYGLSGNQMSAVFITRVKKA